MECSSEKWNSNQIPIRKLMKFLFLGNLMQINIFLLNKLIIKHLIIKRFNIKHVWQLQVPFKRGQVRVFTRNLELNLYKVGCGLGKQYFL